MGPPSHGAREQKLSDGLRKLQEFQRRKEQSVAVSSTSAAEPSGGRGGTSSRSPSVSRQVSHDPVQQQGLHRSTSNVSQSPPQMAAVTPAAICAPLTPTAAVVSPVTIASPTDGELGPRLQHLIGQLAAVAASGATRDLRHLEELQRHCVQLAREADEAQRERQGQAAQLDSLRTSHLQATRTIELLVEEKSRLRTSLDNLDDQLRARAHEAVVRDAEVRSLRERAAISDGQMARLLQEKELWTVEAQTGRIGNGGVSSSNTMANPPDAAGNARLQEHVAELEEQLRLSAEKISYLQRTEEHSRAAYEAARNELEVAQAYVRQLAGTGGDEGGENLKPDTANSKQALEAQLEQLREELDAEKHERSASELIARNLEASNRGLQQRVVELERAASTPIVAQMQLSQAAGHTSIDGHSLVRRDVESQTDIDERSVADSDGDGDTRMVDLARQNELFQTQLRQVQEQLCNERGRWTDHTAALQTRMAATADELQRAKLDASRAVSQNRQLKSQIEELQDVFVKLSNDKLDLTEDVHSERHRAQQLELQLRNLQTTLELQQAQEQDSHEPESDNSVAVEAFEHSSAAVDSRLQQYTIHIQSLEAQLTNWATRYASLERRHAQCVIHEKIEARLHQQQQQQQQVKHGSAASRVVEDEGSQSIDTPQTLGDSPGGSLSLSEYEFVDTPGTHQPIARHTALTSAGDLINNNNGNNIINTNMNSSNNNNNHNNNNNNPGTTSSVHYGSGGGGPVVDRGEPVGGDLTESIGDAMYPLDNLSTTSSRSERLPHDMEQPIKVPMGTPVEATIELAHERRLTEAALKIARLQDEKGQLEHQVEQLRMETDTISDYIQLYQQQRAALNQRQRERDAHIKQLLEDREALSSKVNQLQSLIAKILPVTSNQQQQQLPEGGQPLNPSVATERAEGAVVAGSNNSSSTSPTPNEVIAHKILQTLEDLTEASTAPPAGLNTFYRCSSCQGCHGRLLSL